MLRLTTKSSWLSSSPPPASSKNRNTVSADVESDEKKFAIAGVAVLSVFAPALVRSFSTVAAEVIASPNVLNEKSSTPAATVMVSVKIGVAALAA